MHKLALMATCIIATCMPLKTRASVNVARTYDATEINKNLTAGAPTVDVVLHHIMGSGDDATEISYRQMLREFKRTKNVFARAGVQLNLVHARSLRIPSAWKSLIGIQTDENPETFRDRGDPYLNIESQNGYLSDKARQVFSSLIHGFENSSRQIHVANISHVSFEAIYKTRSGFRKKRFGTAGFSFPAYMLGNRIQPRLRGILTIKRNRKLAHELGHKLINVSHEGLDVCPTFSESDGAPGLMGNGREIHSGAEGRYHRERLHLSPFIYRIRNGNKVYNRDYRDHGKYDDRIYGHYVIKPSCS